MALNFSTAKELARMNGVKVLVYGKAGVGKTVLCATAPKPIIISAESGLLSLRDYDIPVMEIETFADLQEAYLWLTTDKGGMQFETICLDSLTEIAEVVLNNAKAHVKDARQAYGELIEKMLILVKQFRDIKGRNVYFTAKEARIKDDKIGTVNYQPDMPGSKLGSGLAYYFDEVFHMGIAETKEGGKYRYLRTEPDFQHEAKDRSGVLNELEEPDLTKIFSKITIGVK